MYPDRDTIAQLLPARRLYLFVFAIWLLKSKYITKHLMFGPSWNSLVLFSLGTIHLVSIDTVWILSTTSFGHQIKFDRIWSPNFSHLLSIVSFASSQIQNVFPIFLLFLGRQVARKPLHFENRPLKHTKTARKPNKQKSVLTGKTKPCTCVTNLCKFRSRPLQNNNMKWPNSGHFGQRKQRRLIFRIFNAGVTERERPITERERPITE